MLTDVDTHQRRASGPDEQPTERSQLVPGIVSLAAFAYLLTRIDVAFAGRAYAAYGGVYIVASLAWLWLAEGLRPNNWDLAGAGLAMIGALVILAGAQFSR
ncbi:hypothetical protein RM531_03270 [Salinisphaera sp. P385]|uniref:Small multidrug resistance family-3 protein n=1 Tax=Spectribacter acetivorans TaxID=3075603 RepID=A0ABU3B4V8_9GAMM|nr:hypothetical protein [Salinisphaera sp. P385]MDT0617481.1 hypothetical protein [Salinisphaera sp. P385]